MSQRGLADLVWLLVKRQKCSKNKEKEELLVFIKSFGSQDTETSLSPVQETVNCDSPDETNLK